MRIRGTKPEFWRSERIASVSWDARLVLKGLESYVDDNGVGKDDIALIVGEVFPRDMLENPRETVARVSEAISHLHQAGLLWRYCVDHTQLLYVSFWETIQRIDKPGKGRFPRPDGTMDYKSSLIRESVASPRETVAPVTGEQGNRGTGEQKKEGGYVSREPHQATPTDDQPPPPHCPDHPGGNGPPCRACGAARQRRKDWEADQTRRAAESATEARIQAATDRAIEIASCGLCDDDGYRGGVICDHVDRAETAAAGSAAVQAALKSSR